MTGPLMPTLGWIAAIDALIAEGKAECEDCHYSREGCDWHQGYEQGLREGVRLSRRRTSAVDELPAMTQLLEQAENN